MSARHVVGTPNYGQDAVLISRWSAVGTSLRQALCAAVARDRLGPGNQPDASNRLDCAGRKRRAGRSRSRPPKSN